MGDIRLEFTHAARTFAAARNDPAGLEIAARAAVMEFVTDHDVDPLDMFFHCYCFHGQYNMIMSPKDGAMLIDVSEPEDLGPLDTGPFKGKRIVMPRAFSEDE